MNGAGASALAFANQQSASHAPVQLPLLLQAKEKNAHDSNFKPDHTSCTEDPLTTINSANKNAQPETKALREHIGILTKHIRKLWARKVAFFNGSMGAPMHKTNRN